MSLGYRYIVVALVFLLIADLTTPITVTTAKPDSNTYVVSVKNPSNAIVNITFYNANTNEQNESYQFTDSSKMIVFSHKGSWKMVVKVNGKVQETKYFGLGSIIDTGFKSMLQSSKFLSLHLVAIVTIVAIGIFAATIGRYAGVPIIILAIGIFAMHHYIPGWINYVILIVMAFLFATAIYKIIRGG